MQQNNFLKNYFLALPYILIVFSFLLFLVFPPSSIAREEGSATPYGFWVSRTLLEDLLPANHEGMPNSDRRHSHPAGAHPSGVVRPDNAAKQADTEVSSDQSFPSPGGGEPLSHPSPSSNAPGSTLMVTGTLNTPSGTPERVPEGAPLGVSHGNRPKNANSGKDSRKSGRAMPMGHGFPTTRSPIESVYLLVRGGEEPVEAPEVYYKFTVRTLERHGGVPLASTYHKAKVVKDDNGLWRADLVGTRFGTIEVYSRYRVGDETVYSQYNFLHFIAEEEDKSVPVPETVPGLPEDWPVFEFPSSKYNEMPFRGTQTENEVDFALLRYGKNVSPRNTLLTDVEENHFPPQTIGFNDSSGKYTLSPADDPTLQISSGPMGGMAGSKSMVAMVNLPGNESVTFTLSVTRSKWSYRKLGLGLVFVLCTAIVVAIVTAERRRKFKYNESD